MLCPAETIEGKGDIHFCVSATLSGNNEVQCFAGANYPLPDLSVPREIGLQEMRAVLVFIASQHRIDLLIRLEVVEEKYAAPRRKYSWSHHFSRRHSIAVYEDVIGD